LPRGPHNRKSWRSKPERQPLFSSISFSGTARRNTLRFRRVQNCDGLLSRDAGGVAQARLPRSVAPVPRPARCSARRAAHSSRRRTAAVRRSVTRARLLPTGGPPATRPSVPRFRRGWTSVSFS
jgi:hypothetical protein